MVVEDWWGRERVEELAHTESCSSGGGEKGRVVEERVGDEEWHGGERGWWSARVLRDGMVVATGEKVEEAARTESRISGGRAGHRVFV